MPVELLSSAILVIRNIATFFFSLRRKYTVTSSFILRRARLRLARRAPRGPRQDLLRHLARDLPRLRGDGGEDGRSFFGACGLGLG